MTALRSMASRVMLTLRAFKNSMFKANAVHRNLTLILDSVSDGVHGIDLDGNISFENTTSLSLFRHDIKGMVGKPAHSLIHHSHADGTPYPVEDCPIYACLRTGEEATITDDVFWRHDGSFFPVEYEVRPIFNPSHRQVGALVTFRDITERKKSKERINNLAFFDQLTGLPNRTLLGDRLHQAMIASTHSGSYGALLLINIDRFKTLNDTLGHRRGDMLLRQVAKQLSGCVGAGDMVARQGVDEFVVVLSGLGLVASMAADKIEQMGVKILAALNQTYRLMDSDYHITARIGAVLFLGQEFAPEEIWKRLDFALKKGKSGGHDKINFFDPAMETEVRERALFEADLLQALDAGQFLLHYQPQVDITGQVIGVEALLRWQHPERGMVSPAAFIPVAEKNRLILPLGKWVLETACHQLAAWAKQADMATLVIAVNISALQILQQDFVEQLTEILRRTGANPQRLKLELTESLLVANIEQTIEKMALLKSLGISIALDDFGTGYSSLSYLKKLPLNQLKIDQSFVRDVILHPDAAFIVKTLIALADGLGLEVLAEGVETEQQKEFLAGAGCFTYQGYYFSRPLPVDQFEAWQRERLPILQ